MDFSAFITLVVVLSTIGATVYLANLVEAKRTAPQQVVSRGSTPPLSPYADTSQVTWLRWLLYSLIGLMFLGGLFYLQIALFSDLAAEAVAQNTGEVLSTFNTGWALVTFGLAAVGTFISVQVVSSESARARLRTFIGDRYNPQSQVHTVAVVLVLVTTVYSISTLVTPVDVSADGDDLVFQMVLEVVIALLGVGFAIRRDVAETLQRLGLRVPTRADVIWGVGFGVLFIGLSTIVGLVWESLTPPEIFQEQTSGTQSITQAFTTIPLAFLLAATAAIGEEIWIRGALQPVFGVVISSVFFAVLHTQYTLTPAMLIILVLSFGLGWLRQRHSTTASIIAHFVFNFVPLSLAIGFGS
jgi:hypothetical protein